MGDNFIHGIGPSDLHLKGMAGLEYDIPTQTRSGSRLLSAGPSEPERKRMLLYTRAGTPPSTPTSGFRRKQMRIVSTENQALTKRLQALTKNLNPPERPFYTRFMVHEFSDATFMAMRSKHADTEFPGPGCYSIGFNHPHETLPASVHGFAPAKRADGKRCRTGRSCDIYADPPCKTKHTLRLTRQHGPLFDKSSNRRNRRPSSAIEIRSGSSLGFSFASHRSSSSNTQSESGRPTLRSYLLKVQGDLDASLEGDPLSTHTVYTYCLHCALSILHSWSRCAPAGLNVLVVPAVSETP